MAAPVPAAEPVLRIRGARKRFGGTQALDGVDLTLTRGEWLGLLGPNGAGKTTLVQAVAGRVRLDEGTVDLHGRRLGVVPQEIAVYPLLTARENLEIFAALSGMPAAERADRVAWALDFTGLRERADDASRTFSGGMKRRLNLGCSVLHRPEVLLLDEPTVGVDPQSRERIWAMLGQLRDDGASLLLTSHQLDEVERVCERIVILDGGRTIAAGTLDELVARTVGRGRRVTLVLDAPLDGGALDVAVEVETRGRHAAFQVQDVAGELPAVLARVDAAGRSVEDVHVEHPTLQSVFIHLTGRALRE